jgi:hypothetical protein
MRALAEFAMRGRTQAILVAVLSIVLPFLVVALATQTGLGALLVLLVLLLPVCVWISAAVVGLVILRRGFGAGLPVLGWAALPSLAVMLAGGDIAPLAALIGAAWLAVVLRWSTSWPHTLAAAALFGVLACVLLYLFGGTYVQQAQDLLNTMFDQWRKQLPAQQAAQLKPIASGQVIGLLGLGSASMALASALLARWWQATLYNPGGFREEFHQLRLPLPLACGLMAIGLLMALPGPDYGFWALSLSIPFVVAGFALVHGLVGLKGWGPVPLVVLYLSCALLLQLVMPLLLIAALIDSSWDFRGRLRARKP